MCDCDRGGITQRECVMARRELIALWCNLTFGSLLHPVQLPHLLPNLLSLSLSISSNPKHTQYGDTSSDVIVISFLHNAGIYWARDIMIGAVCLNLFLQTVAVYVYNQPITEVGLIFTMLKPAADMVRVVSNYCLRCVVQS